MNHETGLLLIGRNELDNVDLVATVHIHGGLVTLAPDQSDEADGKGTKEHSQNGNADTSSDAHENGQEDVRSNVLQHAP